MVELLMGWAALPLRILLGILFIYHGYPKLFKDFKGTTKFLKKLGFAPASFWAFVLGFVEFFGGLAILLGLLTRIGAGLLIISMLVAFYHVKFKWKKPFQGGYELDLLIIASLITLFLLGAGNLSFDSMMAWMLG